MLPNICFYFPQNAIYFTMLSFPFQMIYLLTAVRLTPGGSSTVHIYTQTVNKQHNRHNQYLEQHS